MISQFANESFNNISYSDVYRDGLSAASGP